MHLALETVKLSGFDCPSCKERLFVSSSGPSACPNCNWAGEAHVLKALRYKVETAKEALPDQAICAHHPTKQAIAKCEATGDYICSLCAVDMDDKVYSISYLNEAGKEALRKRFARYLDRPDMEASILILVSLLTFLPALVFIPFAMLKFWKAMKQRKQDKIYAKAFSGLSMALIGFLVIAATLIYGLMFVSFFL
ncbi:MAG: hypothetical protein OEZ04_12310 [Nitrospinota bacterium]|nr:hypothetical protein [Nitrospinota bacterium]